MKLDNVNWMPFIHENLEYKQKILQIARGRDNNKLEDILTATLIYVNAIDYVASHLLTNLRQISYFVLHKELNATIFYNNKNQSTLTLGKTIEKLKKYEFPDKDEFLEELTNFKKLRNKYAHNFLTIEAKQLEREFGVDLSELYSLAESILTRYDAIVKGITSTWLMYRQSKIIVPPIPQPNSENKK